MKANFPIGVAVILLMPGPPGCCPAQEPTGRATLRAHPQTYPNYRGGALSVVFSPDGKTLASSGRDATIKLWDVKTGKNLATLEGHDYEVWSVAFSPDGKTLASAGTKDKSVKLWDV